MTDRELMQMALDALEEVQMAIYTTPWLNRRVEAIRARLAQPEPEPVAWMDVHDHTNLYYRKPPQGDVVPLYMGQPKELK